MRRAARAPPPAAAVRLAPAHTRAGGARRLLQPRQGGDRAAALPGGCVAGMATPLPHTCVGWGPCRARAQARQAAGPAPSPCPSRSARARAGRREAGGGVPLLRRRGLHDLAPLGARAQPPHQYPSYTYTRPRPTGVKPVVVSHSYGAVVFTTFLHWAEAEEPGWVAAHLHAYVNLAGTLLGVPKAISPMLSGARGWGRATRGRGSDERGLGSLAPFGGVEEGGRRGTHRPTPTPTPPRPPCAQARRATPRSWRGASLSCSTPICRGRRARRSGSARCVVGGGGVWVGQGGALRSCPTPTCRGLRARR